MLEKPKDAPTDLVIDQHLATHVDIVTYKSVFFANIAESEDRVVLS